MKHTIKIENDTLILSVVLEKIKPGESRTRFGMPSVLKLVNTHQLPASMSLGRCLSPIAGLDNTFDDKLSGTWTFALEKDNIALSPTPDEAPPKKSTKKTNTRKKSTRKK